MASALGSASAQDKDYFVYYGTYTGFRYVRHSKTQGVGESHSKGIYVSRFNSATGTLSESQLAAEITNPSFLATTPDHRFLYAVTEDPLSLGPPLDHVSFVSAFAVDQATGKLRLLNTLPTGGYSVHPINAGHWFRPGPRSRIIGQRHTIDAIDRHPPPPGECHPCCGGG